MTLAVGDRLQGGKYQVDAVLSCGRCSTTYRATHCGLRQSVVLKTLTPLSLNEPDTSPSTAHFVKEVRSLAKLHHPHLARVSDCFVEAQQPFMVTDLVPGDTLAQRLAKGPLPEAEAVNYIRQVGQALTCIHTQGLLHRNVKPSNIVVHAQTQAAILVDIGVAPQTSVAASPAPEPTADDGFASLEQSLPTDHWTAAMDVYSLAATLYALCTGQIPTPATQRDRTPLTPPRQLTANLTPALEQAILQGMTLEHSKRSATVEAWLALLTDLEMESSPTVPILEPAAPVPSDPEPKHKSKPIAIRPQRSISTRHTRRSAAPLPLRRSRFLIQALIWSGVIAGFGGAGAGMVLKKQFLSPTFSASPTAVPTMPQQTIQESFPPKLTLPPEDPATSSEVSPEAIEPIAPDIPAEGSLSEPSQEPQVNSLPPQESGTVAPDQSAAKPWDTLPSGTLPDNLQSDSPSTTAPSESASADQHSTSPAPTDSNLDAAEAPGFESPL